MPAEIRAMALAAVGLVALLATACGQPSSPVVPLVKVPKGEALGTPKAAEPAAKPPTQDPKAFTSAEEIAAFVDQCRPAQVEGAKALKAGTLTGGYGKIYQGKSPAPDLGPPEAGVFRWVEGDAEYLDPNLISESAGTSIGGQCFEGLYIEAAGNTPPVPSMAQSHTVSEDGKVWTFKLREGLVWSDGKPLTAEDFKYSWLRGLNPATGSKNAQQLWFIKGAKDYNTGRNPDPASVGLRVVDPLTFEVTLKARTPFFLDLITYIAYAPVPRHTIEEHGAQWTRPGKVVVNGPYTFDSWKPREKIELKKNPRYWDAANVALERQKIFLSDDESKTLRLYETGEVDYAQPVPPDKVKAMVAAGREDLHIDQQMCVYYYVIRLDQPPFDDRRVRQALSLAIDRERLTQHVLGSMQPPATHLVPDMFRKTLGYVPPEGPAFDPEGAKKLLAEAGLAESKALKVDVTYNTFEVHKRVAQFVQRNFMELLDAEVTIGNMEWKSLLKKIKSGNFKVARTSWCADFPDPTTFLNVFDSEGANNYPGYDNPAYDQLLNDILHEEDQIERNAKMCAAERVLMQDLPMIPFYFYTRSYLLRPHVKGFEPQYKDHHWVRYMSFDSADSGAGAAQP